MKDSFRLLVLLVTCGRVQHMQVARVKSVHGVNQKERFPRILCLFIYLFLLNFELTVHTYSLEYAVDNLLCWMLMFLLPLTISVVVVLL